jgi:hypothetical protein
MDPRHARRKYCMDRSQGNFAQLITFAGSPDVPKIITIGSVGTAPHVSDIYSYLQGMHILCLLFLSWATCAGRTAVPILSLDGSFNEDFAMEMPSEGVDRRGYTIGDAGDASLPTGLTKKILRPLNYGRRAQTGGHIVI